MSKKHGRKHRPDAFENYSFRVKWEGRYVAGVRKVGGLKRTTEVIEYREAGDPAGVHKSPGRTSFQAITLELGVTHDLDFEKWASKLGSPGLDDAALRKDIVIELLDEAGEIALAYKVHRAWVSEYQALPDLDANGNAVVIQTLKLENEGWEREEVPDP